MTSVRPEYPRPHFDRSHAWQSLNGTWDFAPDPRGTALPEDLAHDTRWPQRITVPFAWETEASGVATHWLEHGWYRRTLTVPAAWQGLRVVLHFGAVHHHARVWVDGTEVGEHEGGYTPFEFDITDALAGRTTATLLVHVHAPIDKREIVHGKQRSIPRDDYDDCAFTPTSGIWQPVWLEARPATHIASVALAPSRDLDAITADVTLDGPHAAGSRLTVQATGGEPVTVEAPAAGPVRVTLPVAAPRLWSPTDPYLYDVTVTLDSADGADRVGAATGLRRIEVSGDTLLLNGERLYVRGVLDQGYWPRTGLTAPDDEAFITDLELAREAGFNLVRKHLKLEDPRFLHHADRLGMLVWAEPASTGVYSEQAAARFDAQIEPMVARDGNHPSIVIWGLYNEEWGLDWDVPGDPAKQQAVRRAYDLLKSLDATRPVVDNSGWTHVATDLVDWHIYDETPAGWSAKVRALLADGETSFPVGLGGGRVVRKLVMADGSPAVGVPNLNSEFGGGKTSVERGWNQRWQTQELRRHDGLSGYVWTELYDIEHEMAGIYAFDRTLKDGGSNPAAHANADTVLVVDVEPVAPGRDLLVGSDRTAAFDVHVSHHGPEPVEVTLATVWGPQLGSADDPAPGTGHTPVTVHPYQLSEPVHVSESLPDGLGAARLHLLALAEDGHVIARTCVDVADR
ncbi:glycoside hydrolase family 2 protein [Streptantibioticus cattleyicolor]|uniref:Hydrolase n=1 Tax=Streptantibioticus cattleyicolor (strain ATCC 35852 / DSM 46488 / JCM 4925 / NBRC 14057 / NRRL 8057) TaxID=1003195 RepID=F8JK48_STREN|nr:glycoside hydrolase family 2 [Streptantibioticus cattleyicolor]AEW99811.1 hydrolase [Streptantibioticus cattleyicolor NRRL 8057 = DSM 46488]CCB71149.1 putative hydrolase [Streptantibioticus cattleyicolor NRRL 8057 = DSM 46488]